eukprot:976592-Ditylum_brightwellii.AAC.1
MMGMLKWSCRQKTKKDKGRGAIASSVPQTESPTPTSAPSLGISPYSLLLASPKEVYLMQLHFLLITIMHSLINCNAHMEKQREEEY